MYAFVLAALSCLSAEELQDVLYNACPVDFFVSYDPLVSYINDLRSNGSITGVEVWRVNIAEIRDIGEGSYRS